MVAFAVYAIAGFVGQAAAIVLRHAQCMDYPRWDSKEYTGAEDYTCLTYCETGWCNRASYRTAPGSNPTYTPGRVGTYYSLDQMKKSPFLLPVVNRLGVDESVGSSAHEAALTGTHWYPWDSDYAISMMKSAGRRTVNKFNSKWGLQALKPFKTKGGALPPTRRVKACQAAGRMLGVKAWLMNELNVRCEDVPDVVKTAKAYPYDEGGETCEDYQLERDIEDFALQFANGPRQWLGWAGYTCRFNFYQRSCNEDGTQSRKSLNAFGAIPEYYNGAIKKSIVDEWVHVDTTMQMSGLRRADAFKVCCACGGGKKKNRAAPRTLVDVLADSYYVKQA